VLSRIKQALLTLLDLGGMFLKPQLIRAQNRTTLDGLYPKQEGLQTIWEEWTKIKLMIPDLALGSSLIQRTLLRESVTLAHQEEMVPLVWARSKT